MSLHLASEDQVAITHILEEAASIQGGLPQLLSMPLHVQEHDGRVQFVYPQWMSDIREYLGDKYGDNQSASMMQDILFELTTHPGSARL
ncbi:MAG: hypothetical protein HYV16_00825 [Gammaproteobacteria bacterium]|nr:hypothetical protein [Gammaproteobacteria bacterium]